MFWRFGFHNATVIDGILDKEGVVLDDILNEEELIQEVKGQNVKLIDFLSRRENLQLLLTFITSTTLPEVKAMKLKLF
jgi:serine/threonine-protein phosphatase 6 regulatory subunit 3